VHVAVDVASKGCQYLMNGCLQPIGTYITYNAKLDLIDDVLTLIPRMRQRACVTATRDPRPGKPQCI